MTPSPAPAEGLTASEMMALVHNYLGVEGGYLCGFSYATHEAFYPRFCGVGIDVAARRREYGNTRETFLAILRDADPTLQARIVEGAFAFRPLEAFAEADRLAKAAAQVALRSAVARLRGQAVAVDELAVQSAAVEHALQDAAVLVRERGSTSGVDRIHTALHGYLRALCRHHGVAAEDTADAARLFKLLRSHVPALQPEGARQEDVLRILGALATVVDALNPIRNQASLAHPNEALLGVAEAALVLDAAYTLLNYLNRKLR